ncbi:MAG: ribonuclease Z [Prevotella sp.]|nr:ribonuclease Z [Prevotella sp.]
MTPFRIHILGCGSALPTLRHNPSSQIVEMRDKQFMIDCGEGTQLQLRRSRIRFTKLGHVFISHLHGDHCFGLIGMISTFGMLGRTAPLHIFAHKDLQPILQSQIDYFCQGLEFEVIMHAIDPELNDVIYDDRSLTVTTIPLSHRIPCCGFLFKEKPLLPHIRRDLVDMYGIPLSQINNIKKGMDWTSPEGEVISSDKLTLPSDPPRSYAYCSDTTYDPGIAKMIEGTDTLYHECTYADEERGRARKHFHSTASEAASIARDAHARQLVLGHFSARYDNETAMLKQARAIFPNSVLAAEGKVIDI